MHSPVVNVREAQRLQTRARLFDAAVAEIGQSGLAGADVAAIAAATGVARGTFYFHFPTKEHVLVELERTEEAKIVAKLAAKANKPRDLATLLGLLTRQVLAAEERLGPVVFRDMLALHFSATRPVVDETADHPLAEFVIAAIKEAQDECRVPRQVDAEELGVIFMTGLFALLATSGASKSRATKSRAKLLDRYVKTVVKGMETP